MLLQDDFATDPYASRWTDEDTGGHAINWDSTNHEMDPDDQGSEHRAHHNTQLGFRQRVQLVFLYTGVVGARFPGPGLRMIAANGDAYGVHYTNDSDFVLVRYNAGVRTSLPNYNVSLTDAHWYWVTIQIDTLNGVDPLIELWHDDAGTTKPTGYGTWPVRAPDFTHTDTDADALDDDSVHLYAGISGRSNLVVVDQRIDWWQAQSLPAASGNPMLYQMQQ